MRPGKEDELDQVIRHLLQLMIYFHLFYGVLTMKLIFIECKLDECQMITFSWLKVNYFSNRSILVALTPPLFTEFLIISKTFLQLVPFLP